MAKRNEKKSWVKAAVAKHWKKISQMIIIFE